MPLIDIPQPSPRHLKQRGIAACIISGLLLALGFFFGGIAIIFTFSESGLNRAWLGTALSSVVMAGIGVAVGVESFRADRDIYRARRRPFKVLAVLALVAGIVLPVLVFVLSRNAFSFMGLPGMGMMGFVMWLMAYLNAVEIGLLGSGPHVVVPRQGAAATIEGSPIDPTLTPPPQ